MFFWLVCLTKGVVLIILVYISCCFNMATVPPFFWVGIVTPEPKFHNCLGFGTDSFPVQCLFTRLQIGAAMPTGIG